MLAAQYDDGEALWLGAFGYLSHKGELSARLAGYYNQALGGDLVLQPSAELDYYGEDVPELGLGRGLGYAEAGLRLRYEIKEAFAPYVGLSWSRDFRPNRPDDPRRGRGSGDEERGAGGEVELLTVIPAKAGTSAREVSVGLPEVPAFAGMTDQASRSCISGCFSI